MKYSLFLIFSLIISSVSCREVTIENFRPDPKIKSDGFFDFGTLRLKQVKRNNYAISGEFELMENCGNEKELIIEVRSKKSNFLVARNQDKFCNFLKNEKLIMPDIKAKSNYPSGDRCPFPKGKYWLKDFVVDEKKFQAAPPGEYKGRLMVVQNDIPLAAVEVDAKLTI